MSRIGSAACLLCLACVVALGCEAGDRPGGDGAVWSGEIEDSTGVTIVLNPPPPSDGAWGDWRVEERLAVGPTSGRPETDFGYVADVALEADTLYVLDQFAQTVHVFGPDGSLVRGVGGPGEGPGELSRFATTLLLVRADTVMIADWGQGRMHRFGRDGSFVDALSLPGEGARSWWRVAGDGRVHFRALTRYVDEESRWRGEDRLLRAADAWDHPDTVFSFAYREADLGGPGRPALPLVVNAPTWEVLPDGRLVWTTLDDTRLRVHDSTGSLERLIGAEDWVPRPLAPSDEAALLELMGDKLVFLGGTRATVQQLDTEVPETLPPVTTVRAGPEGTIWVQRLGRVADAHPMALNTPDPPTGWGGALWDVLDAEGRRVGAVDLGPRVRVTRVLDDRVVGVRRDELGREEVVVWALERGR
jgi:hypothetical protein